MRSYKIKQKCEIDIMTGVSNEIQVTPWHGVTGGKGERAGISPSQAGQSLPREMMQFWMERRHLLGKMGKEESS